MVNQLSNIITKLKQLRDYIVTQGPLTLATFVDILSFVQSIASQVDSYLKTFGPHSSAQMATDPDAQQQLQEIEQLKSEIEKVGSDTGEKAAAGQEHGLLGNLLNKISPEMKSSLLTIISQLLGKLLAGAGGAAAPTQNTGKETEKS